jgi:uncharacterized protein YbjT (DUF2867 family)
MRILLVGATGTIGQAIASALGARHERCLPRSSLALTSRASKDE